MQAIYDFLVKIWGFIVYAWEWLGDIDPTFPYVRDAWDWLYKYLVDVSDSIRDFVLDIGLNLVEWFLDFINKFLDFIAGYCSFCLGIDGGVSTFKYNLQLALNQLSDCVLYTLNQSGFVQALQILACAMTIKAAMILVQLVRSVRP